MLTIDDPLTGREPPAPTQPQATDAQPAAERKQPAARQTPHQRTGRQRASVDRAQAAPPDPEPTDGTEWREWGGRNRVASFRLPDELLDELADRTAQLGLPIGQTVIAALTALLDLDDPALVSQTERAAQSIMRGRRRARQQRAPS